MTEVTQILTNNQGERPAQILERIIEQGTQNAQATIEKVMSLQVENKIVPASRFGFEPRNGSGLILKADDNEWSLHDNALNQMCDRVRIPTRFAKELLAGVRTVGKNATTFTPQEHELRAELLAHNLRKLYGVDGGRYLVRSVDSEVRGFLTSKYKVLDGKGLLGDFIESASSQGARAFRGIYSDLRYGIAMIMPKVYRLGGRDAVALGVQCKHSDFGCGAFDISLWILRLLCENGMTGQDVIRQIHSGKRLDESFEWSEKTIQLESATVRSAMGDALGSMLTEGKLEGYARMLEKLEEKQVSWSSAKYSLRKKLLKSELEEVEKAFQSNDIVNMPAGQNQWRLANALSLIAKGADTERKLELERMAGSYIDTVAKEKEAA